VRFTKIREVPPLQMDGPPQGAGDWPDWKEVFDALPEVDSLEECEAYATADQWRHYPPGTLVVRSRAAAWIEEPPETGIVVGPKGKLGYVETATTTQCTRCSLADGRHCVVDGIGPPDPLIMFVGAAPGKTEDACGTPYTGPSGKLLYEMLGELGLTQKVYLTNSLRCLLPPNTQPTQEQLDACKPWLKEEIERVRPQQIVALGGIAQEQLRGLGYEAPETSHPASSHRNPKEREIWKRKFRKAIREVLGWAEPPEAAVMPWFEGEVDWESPWLAVDTETEDGEDGTTTELCTVQVSDGTKVCFHGPMHRVGGEHNGQRRIPHDDEVRGAESAPASGSAGAQAGAPAAGGDDRFTSLSQQAVREPPAPGRGDAEREQQEKWRAHETDGLRQRALQRRPIYAHNVRYDGPLIGLDLDDLDVWEDTMIMAYVLRYPRVGLKELGPELTGIRMSPISTVLGTGKNKRSFSEALLVQPDLTKEYALKDAVVTSRLARVLRRELCQAPQLEEYYYEFEKPCVPVLERMERRGVLVDTAGLEAVGVQIDAEIAAAAHIPATALGLTESELRSNKKVSEALLKAGFVLNYKTPTTGAYSVDEGALLSAVGATSASALQERQDDKSIIVRELLKYREFQKLKSTYVDKLLKSRDGRGRVHARFNQCVTSTDRLSSSNPNLQNIPIRGTLGNTIRKVFVAPPGAVIVKADYSQLEVRIYAHYTQEPVLLDAYTHGVHDREGKDGTCRRCDVHQAVADALGIARWRAKNVLFACIYGADAPKIAATAGVPPSEARQFLDDLRVRIPSLLTWSRRIKRDLETLGYASTLFGWRGYYPLFRSPISSESSAALREAANLPIQGTASGIVKRLMPSADRLVRGYDGHLLLQVHDELVFEVPQVQVHAFSRELARVGGAVAPEITVPLRLEVGWGPNWGETTNG